MGFLKKFFHNVFQDAAPIEQTAASFERLSQDELQAHLGIERYGDFILPDAVRPSYDLEVIPSAGFRHDVYRDEESRMGIPVLMAAASKEKLMDIFIELLDPLGEVADVVLETSHGQNCSGHRDLYREQIDMPILQSTLWEFEEMLVNDGCTGIAVLNPAVPQEVQLDEHKLLIVYGRNLQEHEDVLVGCKLPCREDMKFITEAEHMHSTTDDYAAQFEELAMRLGVDAYR